MEEHTADSVSRAARGIKKDTALGIDLWGPRDFSDLPKEMWEDLATLLNAVEEGVAKECARMVLPLCTPTRIYMTGSCRSWIHYINLRSSNGTQKEHMLIAQAVRKIFVEQFPAVSEALEWQKLSE